ncbi:MAG: hypothetical protein HS116_14770 [Planctomycetes bacterium]|nr:hypothetical protein [Planctomycetota bacterium]
MTMSDRTGNAETRGGGLFAGPERLEPLGVLGRGIRAGEPEALKVSDADRLRGCLRALDGAGARRYLELTHTLNGFMAAIAGELLLRWPLFAQDRSGPAAARAAAEEAFARWQRAAGGSAALREDDGAALRFMEQLLAPERLMPPAVETYLRQQTDREPNLVSELMRVPQAKFEAIVAHLDARAFDAAAVEFESYLRACRVRHDLLFRYIWEWGVAVRKQMGPAAAVEAFQAALGGCSFFEATWGLFHALDPEARAAFLAEHLRSHFSGAGREGAVRVVEESDRYRLIFEPCGSGGAIRRALAGTQEGQDALLPDAVPATWGRAGEVPAYCSHCALNELESMKRYGYPLWVTEFDPDPAQPCGWTVFKKPAEIPERYFERLGFRKP